MKAWLQNIKKILLQKLALPTNDLLRNLVYRRLWSSILRSEERRVGKECRL